MNFFLKSKKKLVLFFVLFLIPSIVFASGIIPCGRSADDLSTPAINEKLPCTLCHLIIGVKNLVDFGTKVLITVAAVGIFISGVMYVVSSGSEEAVKRAKEFLGSSLKGFTIVLGAWFIVNITMWALSFNPSLSIGKTNWYTFTCVTASTSYQAPAAITYLENALTHAQALEKLKGTGISVISSGNCSDRNNSSCTSLDGIPEKTINNLIKIKDVCGRSPVITGGTEDGHQSHGIGKTPVDLSWNVKLAECLKSNASALSISKICTTKQDAQYRLNCDYDEPNQHIHVAF